MGKFEDLQDFFDGNVSLIGRNLEEVNGAHFAMLSEQLHHVLDMIGEQVI